MALKNVKEKGANGEREIVALLEPVVREQMQVYGVPVRELRSADGDRTALVFGS